MSTQVKPKLSIKLKAPLAECPCSICYLDMNTLPNDKKTTLSCNHAFCKECIAGWIEMKHNTCPYCRSVIPKRQINIIIPKENKIIKEILDKLFPTEMPLEIRKSIWEKLSTIEKDTYFAIYHQRKQIEKERPRRRNRIVQPEEVIEGYDEIYNAYENMYSDIE